MKTDEKNKKETVDCAAQLQEWKEKFVRVSADLENFRRRIDKERIQWMLVAQSDLIKKMLNIVDDFERALSQTGQPEDKKAKEMVTGFAMIGKSLSKILKQYGLQEIEQIQEFDPTLHEAVVQIESEQHDSGQIVEVLQKGYRLKDQVLRPAKVSVAK